MTRNVHMPVNGFLYSQLKIVAELEQVDCAETVAEAWLRERLDARPEITDLLNMRADARKAADAAWRAKHEKLSKQAAEHRRVAEGLPRSARLGAGIAISETTNQNHK